MIGERRHRMGREAVVVHRARFEETSRSRGIKPFRPNKKRALKSFDEVIVDVIEDAEQLVVWARQAGSQGGTTHRAKSNRQAP